MARLHSFLAVASVTTLAIALPLALGGCVGALVVGGLGAAARLVETGGMTCGGYSAAQERGAVGAVDDFQVKADIEEGLMKAELQLQGRITATVYGGRVLLTGYVPSQQIKAAAEQVAGKTHDVRAVYDEIEVAQTEGVWNDANDAWISARLRSQLILDADVRSVNYTIDTTNGSVYLIGSARSQAELDRATQIARYVPGVSRVAGPSDRELQADFGDLRYVWRHLPLTDVHPQAQLAAEAAEAAGAHGKFWEMYDLLFAHQSKLLMRYLVGYADQLALDERHVEALAGELAGADLAGRAGADHDRIVFSHAARTVFDAGVAAGAGCRAGGPAGRAGATRLRVGGPSPPRRRSRGSRPCGE